MTGNRLRDPPELIHRKIAKRIEVPRRPSNSEAIHEAGRAQTEVQPHVTGGTVTSSAHDLSSLLFAAGGNRHFSANRVAIALSRALQFESDPVSGGGAIARHQGRARILTDHKIKETVAIEIQDRESTAKKRHGKDWSRLTRDITKASPAVVFEQGQRFAVSHARVKQSDVIEDMSVRHQNLLPAAVVEIGEADPESAQKPWLRAETRFDGSIPKGSFSQVSI